MNCETGYSKDVVIVGGGISGLACAYYLHQMAESENTPISMLLTESSRKFGGIIRTSVKNGCLLESGPDAMITIKPAGLELVKELGLEEDLIRTNPKMRRSFVVSGGRLKDLPEGFYMIAPSRIRPFLKSDILTWKGKLRCLLEWLVPASGKEEESVKSFITRRFGRELYERIGQPMVGGIYTGDPSRLSMKHAVPRLRDLEQRHGSVMMGLLSQRLKFSFTSKDAGPRYSLFVSFKNGMQQLVDELTGKLGSLLQAETDMQSAEEEEGGGWKLTFSDGNILKTRHLCLAIPPRTVKNKLKVDDPHLASVMEKFEYESVAIGNYIFKADQIRHDLNGFGFVVPAAENKVTIAASFSSVKFAGRAPEDKVVIRAFAGGAYAREALDLSDTELNCKVLKELQEWLGIQGDPLFSEWIRYADAMPQYMIGHSDRIAELRKVLQKHKGLHVAQAAYDGVGIPDCIAGAKKQAEMIFEQLQSEIKEKV